MSHPSRIAAPSSAGPLGRRGTPIPPPPRILPQAAIGMLWGGVGLLLAAGLLAWWIPVSVAIEGVAAPGPDSELLVVLPERSCEQIGPGTRVEGDDGWSATLQRLEPRGASPRAVGVTVGGVDSAGPACLGWARPSTASGSLGSGQTRAIWVVVELSALSLLREEPAPIPSAAGGGAR